MEKSKRVMWWGVVLFTLGLAYFLIKLPMEMAFKDAIEGENRK